MLPKVTRRAVLGLPFVPLDVTKPQQKPAPPEHLTAKDLGALVDEVTPNGQCPIPECQYQNPPLHATEKHLAGSVIPSWCDRCHVMFVQMVVP